jgi:hypothetical protein
MMVVEGVSLFDMYLYITPNYSPFYFSPLLISDFNKFESSIFILV